MKWLLSITLNICILFQLAHSSEISEADKDYAIRKTIQAENYLGQLKDSENLVEYIKLVRTIHRVHKSTIELYLDKRSDAFLERAWRKFSKKRFTFSIPPQGKTARERISYLISNTYLDSLEAKIQTRV